MIFLDSNNTALEIHFYLKVKMFKTRSSDSILNAKIPTPQQMVLRMPTNTKEKEKEKTFLSMFLNSCSS